MAQRLETVSARRAHAAIVCCLVAGAAFAQADGKSALPRTPSGHPDLSGTYDVATLTPLMRPPQYGEKQFLTAEEAKKIVEDERARMAKGQAQSDPDRLLETEAAATKKDAE